ncbi:MAG: site-2 protease family protein [Solirubrobacteraceae bacterium]
MFRRSRSVKLMSVAGIRIGVDGTWFAMLFLLIFLLSGSFRSALHSSDYVAYLTTVVTVLLFFGSLILHELGHALAARHEGIVVQRIELFLFGGTTYMSREAQTPAEEFKIAIAGPLGTLLVVLICLGLDLAVVGPHRLTHAIALDGTVQITPVLLALSWLLPMNVLILVFNLVPAYPLDGGRMARALIWHVTKDKLRGTQVAAKIGEGFALLLTGFGLFVLSIGDSFEGIWLMLLAFMVWQAARVALTGTSAALRVSGVRVADIMDHEPIVIHGTSTVEQALDEHFLRFRADWLPVVDGENHFIGIARAERAQQLLDTGHGADTVGSILDPTDPRRLQILENRPLSDVLGINELALLGAVVAVDERGVMRGVVTLDQVRRVLESMAAAPVGR